MVDTVVSTYHLSLRLYDEHLFGLQLYARLTGMTRPTVDRQMLTSCR